MGFEKLYEAVMKGDGGRVAAFAAWSRENFGDGRDAAEQMLDQAVEEAATKIPRKYRSIHSKFRRLCLSHLDSVLKLSREWAEMVEASKASTESPNLQALKTLALTILAHKPAVDEDLGAAAEARSYEVPLLRRMIEDMKPIWKIGEKLE